jgi:hypothetical protein
VFAANLDAEGKLGRIAAAADTETLAVTIVGTIHHLFVTGPGSRPAAGGSGGRCGCLGSLAVGEGEQPVHEPAGVVGVGGVAEEQGVEVQRRQHNLQQLHQRRGVSPRAAARSSIACSWVPRRRM